MDVDKLFEDAGKNVSSWDVYRTAIYNIFASLEGGGFPADILLAQTVDIVKTQVGIDYSLTIPLMYVRWKEERGDISGTSDIRDSA